MASLKKHNKRRSTLIVYDQLVTGVTRNIVESRDAAAQRTLGIIRCFFAPGTELLRELRVMNALVGTTVSSREVAAAVLREARVATQRHNLQRLEQEKTALIEAITRDASPTLFDERVAEYKLFATVQTLINDWRMPCEANMVRTAEYEDTVIGRLTEQRSDPIDEFPGADGFVVRMMTKRLNDRYAGQLSQTQRRLIREYTTAVDDGSVIDTLTDVRRRARAAIAAAKGSVIDEHVSKRADTAAELIDNEQASDTSSEALSRHMIYARLIDEVMSTDGKR